MLLFVIQTYLGKTLSQPEVNAIVYFYDTLHFPADLIEYLIEYCVSKGKTSIRYMRRLLSHGLTKVLIPLRQPRTRYPTIMKLSSVS
ncbi:MAG: DnaD domain protein [Lachnospira eligens]